MFDEDESGSYQEFEAFGEKRSIWQPPFPQRFKDAVPLAVELSGFSAEWWEEAMRGCGRWIAELWAGNEIIPDDLGAYGGGYVSDLFLAYLGRTPPAELARALDLRIDTIREVRHPLDAKWYSADETEAADQVERTRRTWDTIRRIVAAFDPAKPKA